MTKTYNIPGTDAAIRADFAQASCPIEVDFSGDGEWRSTPFQVADARHDPREAIRLVKGWDG